MIDFTAVREALANAEVKINEAETAKSAAVDAIEAVEDILAGMKSSL